MAIHLGSNVSVSGSSVLALLDVRAHPSLLEDLLRPAADGRRILRVGKEEIKSAVVALREGELIVFLSPVSVQTLSERAQSRTA